MPSTKGLVLVTLFGFLPGRDVGSGATGFVGTAVTRAFIDAGYPVRGTARSQSKAQKWEGWQESEYKNKVDWAIVEDVIVPGAFKDAMKDIEFVVHTAAPFTIAFKDNEKDMLLPSIRGTENILAAAKNEASVKHMIITSSIAAVIDLLQGPRPGYTYTSKDWNPATYEQAVVSPIPPFVYCASKSLAEKLAWDDKERKFSLTTICPPTIYGPPHQPLDKMEHLNTSCAIVWSLINADDQSEIPATAFPVGVDVRDVAKLHVRAVDGYNGKAKEQRYLVIGFELFNSQAAQIVRSTPEFANFADRVRNGGGDIPHEHYGVDTKEAEALLGTSFVSAQQSIVDTARRLWELDGKLNKSA
ncbi:hypothetical protein D9758_007603 [Tetrapyrgos nigripes]|uniref:3-beta hydroxysteroid dehydrogenase/isomerase domain-containing protein n=1 Tax=Tetrapyrgos nigripes TaxID=182062 RepID=A0A8H5LK10_9AGAR|nr:hypothetical protein D9758_007603 [Tetrapyrgos nigripes]